MRWFVLVCVGLRWFALGPGSLGNEKSLATHITFAHGPSKNRCRFKMNFECIFVCKMHVFFTKVLPAYAGTTLWKSDPHLFASKNTTSWTPRWSFVTTTPLFVRLVFFHSWSPLGAHLGPAWIPKVWSPVDPWWILGGPSVLVVVGRDFLIAVARVKLHSAVRERTRPPK